MIDEYFSSVTMRQVNTRTRIHVAWTFTLHTYRSKSCSSRRPSHPLAARRWANDGESRATWAGSGCAEKPASDAALVREAGRGSAHHRYSWSHPAKAKCRKDRHFMERSSKAVNILTVIQSIRQREWRGGGATGVSVKVQLLSLNKMLILNCWRILLQRRGS